MEKTKAPRGFFSRTKNQKKETFTERKINIG